MLSKRGNSLYSSGASKPKAFSEASIEEVDTLVLSEFELIDEELTLIESFLQPFPTRERSSPIMDGEMNS